MTWLVLGAIGGAVAWWWRRRRRQVGMRPQWIKMTEKRWAELLDLERRQGEGQP